MSNATDISTNAADIFTILFCGENEYVDNKACIPCPAGTVNEAGDVKMGENTSCEAVICEENYRVSLNECVACPVGMTRAAGDDASGEDTVCLRTYANDPSTYDFDFDGQNTYPEFALTVHTCSRCM